jgi:hypothetical protein
MDQTTTMTLHGFEFTVNGRRHRQDISIWSDSADGTHLGFTHNRRRYDVHIGDNRLIQQLLFSKSRAARDVLLSRRHVNNGGIAEQTTVIHLRSKTLVVGNVTYTIHPIVRITLDQGMTITFNLARRRKSIHIESTAVGQYIARCAARIASDAATAARL